ncbi:MAG: extracellular solute-binding protein [Armatimonadetes bacterium]|nr:extracellular solute-binding protein [Armatimonadota bacterium]
MKWWLAVVVALFAAVAPAQAKEVTTIRMMASGQGLPSPNATDPRSLARRAVFEEFHRQNPDVQVINAGGLELSGEKAESNFLMSMAGDTAPDVFYVNFRQYYNYIDQGFCRPLDDLVAKDPSVMDPVNPTILDIIKSYDGHIYALPYFQVAQALYYRKDHFIEAGLDPNRPPKTWDEFYAYAQKLTESAPGRSGFGFSSGPQGQAYFWVNFMWQAGGEIVEPTPSGAWRATIATPAGVTALEFYRKLTTAKWVTGGKTYGPAASVGTSYAQDITAGKTSMWFAYSQDTVLNVSSLPPSVIGIAQMPAGPGGSWNEINAGMWAINANVKDPKKLDACWRFIDYFVSQRAAKVSTDKFVDFGMANLVNPDLLNKFGYERYAATVDPSYVAANRELFKHGKPEPYGRNCGQVYTVLDTAMDLARTQPDRPAMEILQQVQGEMDQVLLGYTPPEIQKVRRTWALGILIAATLIGGVLVYRGFRSASQHLEEVQDRLPAGTDRRRALRFVALCLAPAVLSLLVWAYYPLLKGLTIAFQDYRIMKETRWVGLDNFIDVFTQPIFWQSLGNSFVYVGLTISVGFLLPILLAIALNEIPRFKLLFRTIFYLPAMTSAIVVSFLWRQIYDKSEHGVLNSALDLPLAFWDSLWHVKHVPLAMDWLGSPQLAMFAVVIPGIWAGAGPGSILYLAALKQIPDERYEAADLDGATWIQKIWFITFPGLRALMLINFLGVFIAGFKAMENIFILTGGGPNRATRVIGLEVWEIAFMYLKFGYATAAAWVLGAILIGFTLVQIRNLTRMKFSAAAGR